METPAITCFEQKDILSIICSHLDSIVDASRFMRICKSINGILRNQWNYDVLAQVKRGLLTYFYLAIFLGPFMRLLPFTVASHAVHHTRPLKVIYKIKERAQKCDFLRIGNLGMGYDFRISTSCVCVLEDKEKELLFNIGLAIAKERLPTWELLDSKQEITKIGTFHASHNSKMRYVVAAENMDMSLYWNFMSSDQIHFYKTVNGSSIGLKEYIKLTIPKVPANFVFMKVCVDCTWIVLSDNIYSEVVKMEIHGSQFNGRKVVCPICTKEFYIWKKALKYGDPYENPEFHVIGDSNGPSFCY